MLVTKNLPGMTIYRAAIAAVTVADNPPALTGSASTLTSGPEDTAFSVTKAQLLQGWTDADGDPLSVTGFDATNATFVSNADGSYTITPAANFNGQVVLNYYITDGVMSATASLSRGVSAVNDPPARTGAAAVLPAGTEDTSYTVTKAQLLQGWTDVDGDVLSVTNLTVTNGAAVLNGDGSYTITPTLNYNGPVTINYKVTDGTAPISASLVYNLNAVNDAPALTGAAAALPDGTQDTTYTVTKAKLLQGWTDPEGDTLSTTAFACNHGTFVSNADGSYTITPTSAYNGAVQISYSVTDGTASTRAFLNFNLAAAATPVMTALATISETTVGDAGTFVLWPVDSTDATGTMALLPRAGMASDFSNIRITLMDGITDVPFWIDPDAITGTGILAKGLAIRSSARAFKVGLTTGGKLSNGLSTFDIFMDPTDTSRANVTDVLALTGSYATTQKGLNQADCGMGALGYLNQGYCHSATQRFIADSAANSVIRCYNKNDPTNTPVWTVVGNGHMNQLALRTDNGNILASSTGGTGTGIVYEYSHVDGHLVRAWDFSALVSTAQYYPMFAGIDGATGRAKFRLMPTIGAAAGIWFIDVVVNDADGTYTTLYTRKMPSSSGAIQTMQGLYTDYNGAILGDGVDRVWYLVNTSGGKMLLYVISFPDTTTAAISHRYGTYTWGVESEGIGFDGTTLELGVGTSGTNGYIAKVTFDGRDARFRNGAPRVTSAGSQTFSNKTLTAAGLTGKVMCRGRALWSSPYVYNTTSNRAAIGFSAITGDTPFGCAWPGRISATPSKTQVTIRTQSNGGTGVTSATATITDQTVLGLWESVLVPQSAAGALDGSLTVFQNGTQVIQATGSSVPLASDYGKMRAMIGGGAQSDSTGMDQLTGPVCVYALQTTASVMTAT